MGSPNDATARFLDVLYKSFTNEKATRREIDFITSQIKPDHPLLDLGSGTGRHVIPLIKRGYTVVGIDESKEMIKILKGKLRKEKLEAEIIYNDIQKIKKLDYTIGGAICFWNAISEIAKTEKEGKHVFNIVFKSLVKGGKLIIEQNINPDDFKSHSLEFKAKVGNKETEYKVLNFDEKTNTSVSKEFIVVKGRDVKKYETTIVQKWWKMTELEKLCNDAGFSKAEFYGRDFLPTKKPKTNLILVATK
jgi:cyclopropane fatty-acyl-phospholipid synthase-like methyltransferase